MESQELPDLTQVLSDQEEFLVYDGHSLVDDCEETKYVFTLSTIYVNYKQATELQRDVHQNQIVPTNPSNQVYQNFDPKQPPRDKKLPKSIPRPPAPQSPRYTPATPPFYTPPPKVTPPPYKQPGLFDYVPTYSPKSPQDFSYRPPPPLAIPAQLQIAPGNLNRTPPLQNIPQVPLYQTPTAVPPTTEPNPNIPPSLTLQQSPDKPYNPIPVNSPKYVYQPKENPPNANNIPGPLHGIPLPVPPQQPERIPSSPMTQPPLNNGIPPKRHNKSPIIPIPMQHPLPFSLAPIPPEIIYRPNIANMITPSALKGLPYMYNGLKGRPYGTMPKCAIPYYISNKQFSGIKEWVDPPEAPKGYSYHVYYWCPIPGIVQPQDPTKVRYWPHFILRRT